MAQYVRLTWCDTMGIARSKIATGDAFENMKEGEVGMVCLASVFGADTLPANYPKFVQRGYPDYYIVPDMESAHRCPWYGGKIADQVAEVMVCYHDKDQNKPSDFDTRHVCSKLVKKLKDEFGFEILSALEYEFGVAKDGMPVTKGYPIYSNMSFKKMEPLCFTIADRAQAAGIKLETLQHEFGDGQLEIVMAPARGLTAADNAFLFKQCVKETALEFDMHATFMCNPWGAVQNGGHFNFSVWQGSGNVFNDPKDANGLSATAKHWIAGILEHAPAITALICQTNNCYQRFYEGGFAPYFICYGPEHRGCMIRVKKSKRTGVFLELRSSGAAANPYLVLSAVLAAGMDGLRRKLKVQPIGFNSDRQIPRNLSDALDALEKDKVIEEALGQELMEIYLVLKREKDLPVKKEDQFAFYSEHI